MVVLCTATSVWGADVLPDGIWRVLTKAGIAELHADLTDAWLAWESRDVENGL